MIQIGDKLISDDVIEELFVCNLRACKGVCCIEGDEGAPLEEGEPEILEQNYDAIAPFLREEGRAEISRQGKFIANGNGVPSTPLIDGKACAYLNFDELGIAKCGIQSAYEAGAIQWIKPVSCHLYPIRIEKYSSFEAVNYERWDICKDACTLGKDLKVPVYVFLREPLIRKYGEAFYLELEQAALHLKSKNYPH